MTEDEFWSATDQLKLIHQWARARYAAPWAVLGAVLPRVAATTEPPVQLPGVIGGPASLNLLVAFVAPSGGGKGISDKVARAAWPADITERPIGSGEGIAALFKEPKNPEDRITRAILHVPEIDTLAGMAKRQGNILLAQLKSVAMGELIGQQNAAEGTTRVVQAHTYRCCLSVGVQPGHASVLFDDTSGGSPQRFLWFPTVDPAMPAVAASDPAPLDTSLPSWARTDTVIQYGHAAITEQIIAAHLARQRGEGDALDGHWMLTRCKVAGIIAILHHRMVVSELDWDLSEVVMAKSDETRNWMLEHARQAARAKVKERAIARAVGDEVYDNRLLDGVKRSILRTLERDGEQAGNVLRSRMGKRDRRDLFDQAIALLEHDGLVVSTAVERGTRYRLSGVQGEPPVQGLSAQVSMGEPKVQGEPAATVTDLGSRRSHEIKQLFNSCGDWLEHHRQQLFDAGETTPDGFAVKAAARAAGYTDSAVAMALNQAKHRWVVTSRRGGRNTSAVYDITGQATGYQAGADIVNQYLDTLPANTDYIDKDHFKAALPDGITFRAAERVLGKSSRVTVERDPDDNTKTRWRLVASPDEQETSA